MTTIDLKYDAFNLKTILTVNGKDAALRCFGTGRETLLREWIDSFFPELVKFCNLGPGAECAVHFYGTQSDFEDISNAHKAYCGENSEVKIDLAEYKRYPQALDEIGELVIQRRRDCETAIEDKKAELKKRRAENEEQRQCAGERKSAELDALVYKFEKESKELIERVYTEETAGLEEVIKMKLPAAKAHIKKEANAGIFTSFFLSHK